MKMADRIKDWAYTPARSGECTKFLDYIQSCAVRNKIGDGPWLEYEDGTFGMILDQDLEDGCNIVNVKVKYPGKTGSEADVKKICNYFGFEDDGDTQLYTSSNDEPVRDANGVETPGLSSIWNYTLKYQQMGKMGVHTNIEIQFYGIDPDSTDENPPCMIDAYLTQSYTFFDEDYADVEFPEHDCAAFFMEKIFDYYDSGDSDEDIEYDSFE